MIAAPLTKGSATGEGVNQPGRRQEDDVNLVVDFIVANTLKSQRGKDGGGIGPEETLVTGPLGGGNDGTGHRDEDDPNLVTTLRTSGHGGSNNLGVYEHGDAPTLDSTGNVGVQTNASVRRLTPTECERLQALPDGWTQLGSTPDSRRYAALGDAVTATVAEWIGRRLACA